MVRRSAANDAPDVGAPDITSTAAEDIPGVPPGVRARVKVEYDAQIKERGHDTVDASDELNRLALAHADDDPIDPLSEFLEQWANYSGYNCMVMRLPDPSSRRMQGQTYNRPHLSAPESLGAITFDPNPINFINSLRLVNGDSGGCFQVWLVDHNGGRIQGAILYSYAIGDPPRQQTADRRPQTDERITAYPQQAPAPKSESEIKLERTKDQLFDTALSRALTPPVAAPGGNDLSAEDNAKLFILGQPGMLDSIFGNMAELARKAAAAGEPSTPTMKDRALDAAVQLITTNPAIVDRLSGVVERIVARVLPDPRYDGAPLPPPSSYYPQPYPQPPQPNYERPTPQPQMRPSFEPGAPVGASSDLDERPEGDDMDDIGDEDTVDILDDLLTLLNSNDPLTLDPPPPAIAQLLRQYPLKAKMALRLIAAQPLDDIVDWIKETGGKPYVSLLDGASGPFLRGRLAEFKRVCEQARDKVKEKEVAATPETAPPAKTVIE